MMCASVSTSNSGMGNSFRTIAEHQRLDQQVGHSRHPPCKIDDRPRAATAVIVAFCLSARTLAPSRASFTGREARYASANSVQFSLGASHETATGRRPVGAIGNRQLAYGQNEDAFYKLGPDSLVQEGVPQGKLVGPQTSAERGVSGHVSTRIGSMCRRSTTPPSRRA